MTEKLVNGDYVKNSKNELETVDYFDEIIQNIGVVLQTKRGNFYPNKDFGSLIRKKPLQEPQLEYALSYARQALDTLDGVYVKSVSAEDNMLIFDILINDIEGRVSVKL